MQSPFPGMDPYLEHFWPDIHASLIIYTRDQIEEQLPGNLIARVEERVVQGMDFEESRSIYPDVKITERSGRTPWLGATPSQAAVIEPTVVEYVGEPATETCLNILETGPGQRLVTVIEILSASNKSAGEGQRQYRQKQMELRETGVGLVEIDLLRRGQRVLSLPTARIPPRIRTTYQACVRRGWQSQRYEVYPMPLRCALPTLRLPLREADDDVKLDLQAILAQAYRKGRYQLTIDYGEPTDPPLSPADAKWARTLTKAAGKQKSGKPIRKR